MFAALDGIRELMRELQWTASRLFLDTDRKWQIRFAPETWRTVRDDLEDFLRTIGERMEDARRNNTTPPPPDAEETPLSQPRRVECPVCMVNLPTVALRLCGHTLCRTCADRVHTCPTCRALIVGRFNIFLPSWNFVLKCEGNPRDFFPHHVPASARHGRRHIGSRREKVRLCTRPYLIFFDHVIHGRSHIGFFDHVIHGRSHIGFLLIT
ncbi:hypothetical protein J6590_097132 [Homalodisca vitripennis]|nr:hypothetical protein J6590_097132 [Homalodisca vitripennis]